MVLVHGNWSSAAQDWKFFQFLNAPPFQMYPVDYSSVLSLGVNVSAGFVLPQIANVTQIFNALNHVASVQTDIIAYSLGRAGFASTCDHAFVQGKPQL